MSDAPMPLPAGPPAHSSAALIDPLAGDWSEGLPGPLRALGVPAPRRLTLEIAAPAPAEPVAAPAAWEGATADPLHSTPPGPVAAEGSPAPIAPDVSAAPAHDAPPPWSEPWAHGEAVEGQAAAAPAWAEAASQAGTAAA